MQQRECNGDFDMCRMSLRHVFRCGVISISDRASRHSCSMTSLRLTELLNKAPDLFLQPNSKGWTCFRREEILNRFFSDLTNTVVPRYTFLKWIYTESSLNIVLFPKNFQYFATSPSPALGCCCTVNGQPIRVTVHSDLRSDELLFYMQGMGCSELEKKHKF